MPLLTLSIYDLQGRHIKTLASGDYSQGSYHEYWDATDKEGHVVSSGIYLYQLKTSNETLSRKMVFIK